MSTPIPTAWDIAKAVAEELRAHTFTPPVPTPAVIKAKFRHVFDPAKAPPSLTVTVIPDRLVAIETLTRSDDQHTPGIVVAVQKKLITLGDAEDEEAGTLLLLTTTIAVFLSRQRLASVPAARRKEVSIPSLWNPAEKEECHTFTAFLRVSYTLTVPTPV